MYYDVADTFGELVKHKFVWFIAGDGGKAYHKLKSLEEVAKKAGINYSFAEWSAKLPESSQMN